MTTQKLVCLSFRPSFDSFVLILQGKDEFLGVSIVIPTVRLTLDVAAPRLDWVEIIRYNKSAGEMLAAFELLLDEGGELPFAPPKASHPHTHYLVPSGIRPVLQKMRIEVSQKCLC